MRASEPAWTIRFAAIVRQMFSRIPRGEAARFDEAIQLLRMGPTYLPNVEQLSDNVYQYSANRYRIAFEILQDVNNTVRIIAFQREMESE